MFNYCTFTAVKAEEVTVWRLSDIKMGEERDKSIEGASNNEKIIYDEKTDRYPYQYHVTDRNIENYVKIRFMTWV